MHIKEHRKTVNMTQDDLARTLGVSKSLILRYENRHTQKRCGNCLYGKAIEDIEDMVVCNYDATKMLYPVAKKGCSLIWKPKKQISKKDYELINGKGKVEDMKNYTSREELENSRSFQDWFCGRHDEIDNAAHKLLCTIARQEIEWDAEMISKIAEYGEELLIEAEDAGESSCHACRPFFADYDGVDVVCFEIPKEETGCTCCTKTKQDFI